MFSYSLGAAAVHSDEPLAVVVAALTRPEGCALQTLCVKHGCAQATLHERIARVRDALRPRPPGPVPCEPELLLLRARLQRAEHQLQQAHAELARRPEPRAGAVTLDPQRLARLEAVMASHNVTFRGMREILSVAFGPEVAPSIGTLHAHVHEFGRRARRLLERARAQVRGKLACIAGDDVFLHGVDVKVVSEPRSNAVLNVGPWPGREAADWALWTEEYTALKLFVSDLGTDLVGAVDARELAHIIDYWHEIEWWREHLFEPLAREEQRHRAARDKARAAARAVKGTEAERREARNAAGRAETARARAEREFYLACEAEELLRALYEPLRSNGLPWTEAAVERVLAEMDTVLNKILHEAVLKAQKHLWTNAARYGTHRVLFAALKIELRAGSPWRRDEVLAALAQERVLLAQAADQTRTMEEQDRAARQARQLGARLRRHCLRLEQVRAQWADLVDWPRRSSSGTESFNNRLRVLQVVQRHVSEERMSLHALAFNMTPREAGRRRGQSPYQLLGIDFVRDGRPWYDLLLEAA
jgi:hypothetical protein